MKRLLTLFILFYYGSAGAQKKPIDFNAIERWPRVDTHPKISNDGRYVAYTIESIKSGRSLIVEDTEGAWRRTISQQFDADGWGSDDDGQFTQDNRYLIFSTAGKDSIGLLDLKKNSIQYILHASNFQLPKSGNGRWLICRHNTGKTNTVLMDLWKGHQFNYNTGDFLFDNSGRELVMQLNDASKKSYVILIHLDQRKIDTICRDIKANQFVFGRTGGAIAFLGEKQGDFATSTNLMYYKAGFDSARTIHISLSSDLQKGVIQSIESFSKNVDKIFIRLTDTKRSESTNQSGKMTLFHYRDAEFRANPTMMACVDLADNCKVILFEKDHKYYSEQINDGANGNYAACFSRESLISGKSHTKVFLVPMQANETRLLCQGTGIISPRFSIGGHYYVWFNADSGQWFSYNIAKDITVNITSKITEPLTITRDEQDVPDIIGWTKNEESVFIYDRNTDIWKVAMDGHTAPLNITNGFASTHQILFSHIGGKADSPLFINNHYMLLTGFDKRNKNSNFYRLNLSGKNKPVIINSDSAVYYYDVLHNILGAEEKRFAPIKAQGAEVFLVKRMTTSAYPDLYVTHDFKQFRNLTCLSPQKEYNWYTTELRQWETFDHHLENGILFKPEDFNPDKKYPVILYYYQLHSGMLHVFIHPEFSRGTMSIPWYVSNGYLVFVPDIHCQPGHPGESAYNSIVSAARNLASLPYVDSRRMGLQGHSFGGYETNYVVSRTNMFAAAAPSEGVSDIISEYAQSDGKQIYYENGQGRIDVPFWENPGLYIENSPIATVDRVNTPLLILHNLNDRIVSFNQGREMFSDLARLKKQAWLLSYDAEGHSIEKLVNRIDYSTRLSQFFDYYLKGLPPPLWMTQGTRGAEGLKLDLQPDAKP